MPRWRKLMTPHRQRSRWAGQARASAPPQGPISAAQARQQSSTKRRSAIGVASQPSIAMARLHARHRRPSAGPMRLTANSRRPPARRFRHGPGRLGRREDEIPASARTRPHRPALPPTAILTPRPAKRVAPDGPVRLLRRAIGRSSAPFDGGCGSSSCRPKRALPDPARPACVARIGRTRRRHWRAPLHVACK